MKETIWVVCLFYLLFGCVAKKEVGHTNDPVIQNVVERLLPNHTDQVRFVLKPQG